MKQHIGRRAKSSSSSKSITPDRIGRPDQTSRIRPRRSLQRAMADTGRQWDSTSGRAGTSANTEPPGRSLGAAPKSEAAFDDTDPEQDVKKENGGAGALIGGAGGAAAGALAGGLLGAGLGALAGSLIGGALGGVRVTWPAADYASSGANGSSTTVEKPFVVDYDAEEDAEANEWKLRTRSITGGVTIRVRTGGSRNPFSNPPTTEADAQNAVTVMKGYYNRGSRGAWHTEAATRAHEEYHYREWKCASNHYWPVARRAIHHLTVPKSSHPTKAGAITAMRSGSAGADAIVSSFQDVSHDYWFTLADNARSRPYAAGQRGLNPAIQHVQRLAGRNSWTVDSGTDSPSIANPCYQSWLPYSP